MKKALNEKFKKDLEARQSRKKELRDAAEARSEINLPK